MFWYEYATIGPMIYGREVFANAPLAWAACEIRFPLVPSLTSDESFGSLTEAFFDTFPIPRLSVMVPPTGALDTHGAERQFRFLDKSHTMSVSLTRSSLLVETTDYKEWDSFKSVVTGSMEVVARLARIVGVERVGLRYIDEIRVSDIREDALKWKGWISEDVLGHLQPIPGYAPKSSLAEVHLAKGSSGLTVRYAALTGRGVVSDEPLKRRHPAQEGPFFVIDTDSFCDTPGEEMLSCAADDLAHILDELHDPMGTVFQRAITDRLRKQFREEV